MGHDREVDRLAGVADRDDLGVVEVAGLAQEARRLLDRPAAQAVAALEQKLLLDHPLAGGAVEAVRQPVEPAPLLRVLGVEDVVDLQDDPADDRALSLHLVERWQGSAGAALSHGESRPRSGERRQGERGGEQQRRRTRGVPSPSRCRAVGDVEHRYVSRGSRRRNLTLLYAPAGATVAVG